MGSVNDYDKHRLEFARHRIKVYGNPRVGVHHMMAIAEHVEIVKDPIIKAGAVIGEKGFSHAFDEDLTPVPMIHTGSVIIGDYVEIGALTTVARGTINNTILEDYVRLDDHVHIAHNCKIGKRTCAAAGAILGGSVTVGPDCWIGLGCVIQNGLTIGKRALIGSGANVVKDVPPHAVMVGNPARILRYRDD